MSVMGKERGKKKAVSLIKKGKAEIKLERGGKKKPGIGGS